MSVTVSISGRAGIEVFQRKTLIRHAALTTLPTSPVIVAEAIPGRVWVPFAFIIQSSTTGLPAWATFDATTQIQFSIGTSAITWGIVNAAPTTPITELLTPNNKYIQIPAFPAQDYVATTVFQVSNVILTPLQNEPVRLRCLNALGDFTGGNVQFDRWRITMYATLEKVLDF